MFESIIEFAAVHFRNRYFIVVVSARELRPLLGFAHSLLTDMNQNVRPVEKFGGIWKILDERSKRVSCSIELVGMHQLEAALIELDRSGKSSPRRLRLGSS